MIVELWIQQIMDGKKTFNDVPRLLKPKVRACLISQGRMDLALPKKS